MRTTPRERRIARSNIGHSSLVRSTAHNITNQDALDRLIRLEVLLQSRVVVPEHRKRDVALGRAVRQHGHRVQRRVE